MLLLEREVGMAVLLWRHSLAHAEALGSQPAGANQQAER